MKDGVVIVNTARGKVINENALVNGLENGKVSAVGLDVYEGVIIFFFWLGNEWLELRADRLNFKNLKKKNSGTACNSSRITFPSTFYSFTSYWNL